MGELWQGVGERPAVGEYAPEVRAELLLQCGTLSGFLGDAQARDVQEKAKDMLSEALRLFQASNNPEKVSEAKCELGCCYFRLGAYDEARIVYEEALTGASPELHGKIIVGSAIIEIFTGHY